MTRAEFSEIMEKIEHYYPRFFSETDKQTVFEAWYEFFAGNPKDAVMRAVKAHISTSKFAPTIADIKSQMVESFLKGKPTSIQAFHTISNAVKKSFNPESAAKAYNELPPILKKLTDNPSQLIAWNNVDDSAFQTVIMSAIRESYKEIAKQEADFFAFPLDLQMTETWRIEAPEKVALPEPQKRMSVEEIIEDANAHAAAHGMKMTEELAQKHASRVDNFLKPMTADEKKRVELAESRKAEWSLK